MPSKNGFFEKKLVHVLDTFWVRNAYKNEVYGKKGRSVTPVWGSLKCTISYTGGIRDVSLINRRVWALLSGTLNFADIKGCKFAELEGWKAADTNSGRVGIFPTLFLPGMEACRKKLFHGENTKNTIT